MATIEERAREFAINAICFKHNGRKTLVCEKYLSECNSCERLEEAVKLCIDIATEQDRIARQEERERCIRIAQECVKELIDTLVGIKQVKGTIVIEFDVDAIDAEIRKAMEGGEG